MPSPPLEIPSGSPEEGGERLTCVSTVVCYTTGSPGEGGERLTCVSTVVCYTTESAMPDGHPEALTANHTPGLRLSISSLIFLLSSSSFLMR